MEQGSPNSDIRKLAASFANKAVAMTIQTIQSCFGNYYMPSSASSKQNVNPQTKPVPPVVLPSVNSSPLSQRVFVITELAGNKYYSVPLAYQMSTSPTPSSGINHNPVMYNNIQSPSDDNDLDHRIRIINSPSPSSSSSSSSSVPLQLSLPENILRLVQSLNCTLNLDGETNGYLMVLNHHRNPNPRLSVLQKSELGKMIFGVVAPLTMGLLAIICNYSLSHSPLPRLIVLFVVYTLSFGSALIWNGILLRDMLPKSARLLEEFGIAVVFLAFFGLVTSILPLDLVWAACLCYLLTVLPIVVLWFHDAGGTD